MRFSVKLSIILALTIVVVMAGFTYYLVEEKTKELDKRIFQKGITYAQIGAKVVQRQLETIVDNGLFTINQLFYQQLVPISLPDKIVNAYKKQVSDEKIKEVQKYHYITSLDSYLDNAILEVEDQFLIDKEVSSAILMDKNGYLPTHNSIYSQRLTGNFEYDLRHNRTKRIFNIGKEVVKEFEQNKKNYVEKIYKKDTGEELRNISVPVYVKGKLWGSFSVGISLKQAEKMIAASRWRLIILMICLLIISILTINVVTYFMMRPLKELHNGVKRIAKGDFSFRLKVKTKDEIGDLATTFNQMTSDLTKYVEELKKTTAEKERMESELKIAKDIQMGILPKIFPPFPEKKEFDIYATLIPAREVGGDLYDFFFVEGDYLYFAIGDVSDKGIPASLFMVITRTLLKIKASLGFSPDKVLTGVNKDLSLDNPYNMFVTLFLGVLNIKTGELIYSNGGHNPPFIIKESGEIITLPSTKGIALGVIENFEFEAKKIVMEKGDIIFLYTDGVNEARNIDKHFYTTNRLINLLKTLGGQHPEKIINTVIKEIEKFSSGAYQYDDITMLSIRYIG